MSPPLATLDPPEGNGLFDAAGELRRLRFKTGVDPFRGSWAKRNPFNVPGPIYVTEDDQCGTGPLAAPNNICLPSGAFLMRYPGELGEFVFRQPSTAEQIQQIVVAARTHTLSGYAFDGDKHWTRSGVSQWWRQVQPVRATLREWVAEAGSGAHEGAAAGLQRPHTSDLDAMRGWLEYLDHGVEAYLERYSLSLPYWRLSS